MLTYSVNMEHMKNAIVDKGLDCDPEGRRFESSLRKYFKVTRKDKWQNDPFFFVGWYFCHPSKLRQIFWPSFIYQWYLRNERTIKLNDFLWITLIHINVDICKRNQTFG